MTLPDWFLATTSIALLMTALGILTALVGVYENRSAQAQSVLKHANLLEDNSDPRAVDEDDPF